MSNNEDIDHILQSIPLDKLIEYAFLRLCDDCHAASRGNGFWDHGLNIGEKIALMHSELSEALEAFRTTTDIEYPHLGPMSEKIPEFRLSEEELADLIIRLSDLCGGIGLNVGAAIVAKRAYNDGRPYKHGKKF